MKGIFWNSKGFSDLAKKRFLLDTLKEHNLEFIALFETGKKDFKQPMLDGLCGGRNFIWHWSEPHGRSGGILLGLTLNFFISEVLMKGTFMLNFFLEIKRTASSGFWWQYMVLPNLNSRKLFLQN